MTSTNVMSNMEEIKTRVSLVAALIGKPAMATLAEKYPTNSPYSWVDILLEAYDNTSDPNAAAKYAMHILNRSTGGGRGKRAITNRDRWYQCPDVNPSTGAYVTPESIEAKKLKKKYHGTRPVHREPDPFEALHAVMSWCGKGLITADGGAEKPSAVVEELGDIFDVYCVAKGRKPLAAFNYSPQARQELKKCRHADLIDRIFRFASQQGVEMIHFNSTGRVYTTIVFKENDYEDALRAMLMACYLTDAREIFELQTEAEFHSAFGMLLGYSNKDIRAYSEHYGAKVTKMDLARIRKRLQNFTPEIEEMHSVLYFRGIPSLL
jgi:hypothetical protein